MSRSTRFVGAMVVAAVSLALSPPLRAAAEEEAEKPDAEALGFVTGKSWTRSSYGERAAYLVGIGNLLNVEYAIQQRSPNPPTSKQSLIPATWKAVGPHTVDHILEVIDDWYESNPDQRDTPVLDVIWDQMVEPTLGRE